MKNKTTALEAGMLLFTFAYIDPDTGNRETFIVRGFRNVGDPISQGINILKQKLNCRLCFPQWNKELQAWERPR